MLQSQVWAVRLNIKNSPAVSLNCYCICWALKLAQVVRGKPVHHCVVCLLIPFSCWNCSVPCKSGACMRSAGHLITCKDRFLLLQEVYYVMASLHMYGTAPDCMMWQRLGRVSVCRQVSACNIKCTLKTMSFTDFTNCMCLLEDVISLMS